MIANILLPLLSAALAGGTLEVRTGLLDRLVQHYKNSFLKDLVDVAPVKIKVSLQRAPPGFVESPDWNYDSVMRLISLIRESESDVPLPVRRALQAVLPLPTRRYLGMGNLHKARMHRQKMKSLLRRCLSMSNKDPNYPRNCPHNLERVRKHQMKVRERKYNLIPKHEKPLKSGEVRRQNVLIGARKQNMMRLRAIPSYIDDPADIYYDERMSIEITTMGDPTISRTPYDPKKHDDDIFVIENPVEAKLPSKELTLGQLRRILDERAEAARWMPPRPTTTVNYGTLVREKSNDTDNDATGDTTVGEAATGDGEQPTGGDDEAKPEEDAAPDGEEKPPDEEAPAEE